MNIYACPSTFNLWWMESNAKRLSIIIKKNKTQPFTHAARKVQTCDRQVPQKNSHKKNSYVNFIWINQSVVFLSCRRSKLKAMMTSLLEKVVEELAGYKLRGNIIIRNTPMEWSVFVDSINFAICIERWIFDDDYPSTENGTQGIHGAR